MDIVDLNFTGKETTQERLIKATQALIAIYGYDATTTRMIANTAGVTLSTDRIHHALNYNQSWINIGIAEHENGLPESSRGIMADVVVKTSEAVLAELIEAVSVRPNPYMAMLMARSISATIMTMMEKAVLLNKLAEYMDIDIGDKTQLEMAMHDYFMRSIEANVSRHPWQK